jgi:hypothetical protein
MSLTASIFALVLPNQLGHFLLKQLFLSCFVPAPALSHFQICSLSRSLRVAMRPGRPIALSAVNFVFLTRTNIAFSRHGRAQ